MTKLMTIAGAVLLAASTAQIAYAGQRDKVRKSDPSQVTQSQQFRDSNAYYGTDPRDRRGDDYRYSYERVDSLYPGGAISAPAGR